MYVYIYIYIYVYIYIYIYVCIGPRGHREPRRQADREALGAGAPGARRGASNKW